MRERTSDRCACVILAAGASRRLGTPKQLLRMAGETLIHRAVRLAQEAGFSPVYVVLGSAADAVGRELSDNAVVLVRNEEWEQGMSTSLRVGIARVVAERPETSHILVMVCDQAKLSADVLSHLYQASTNHPDRIIAAAYGGSRGVPAIFPAAYFDRLCTIKGDRGARLVIEESQHEVLAIDFPAGTVDIDTADDARRAGLTESSI